MNSLSESAWWNDQKFSSKRELYKIPWKLWKQLISLLERVKIDCHFINGHCLGAREKSEDWLHDIQDTHCCCEYCAKKIGYIKEIFGGKEKEFKENKKKIEELYNEKWGFWRKGIGCILPRILRSETCNGYICESLKKRYEKNNQNALLFLFCIIRFGGHCEYKIGKECDYNDGLELITVKNGKQIKVQKRPIYLKIEKLEQLLIEEGSIKSCQE